MYKITVIITALLMIVSPFYYVALAWRGKTKPVPATWILMMVMMSLSFWMYWVSPEKSWTKNIAVTTGIFNVGMILVGVIAVNLKYNSLKITFDKTQKWCLAGGVAVVIFWFFTDEQKIAYTLVQLIALIAYVATVRRLLKADDITEPVIFWVMILMATSSAIYPALVNNSVFAWIYLIRAVPSTILMIFLIQRMKMKRKEVK